MATYLSKYRKKTGKHVKIVMWYEHGDHPDVFPFRNNSVVKCPYCGRSPSDHGVYETFTKIRLICPGTVMATGFNSEVKFETQYSFNSNYEKVPEEIERKNNG